MEEFFLLPAVEMPQHSFLLGGAGWDDRPLLRNIHKVGHVATRDHNAFNATPRAVLNISRASMAEMGFSPATRVFEAAGAGACLITDAWEGVEMFFAPDREILVARDGHDVAAILRDLTRERAAEIGRAALDRALRDHSYESRATQADRLFRRLRHRSTIAE